MKKRGLDIRFHSFPFNHPELVVSWRRLSEYTGPVNKNTGICSDHFTRDQYKSPEKRASIWGNAVPSLKLPGQQLDEEDLNRVSMDFLEDSGVCLGVSYVSPTSLDCGIQTEYVNK